jgi:hypothetical protein
MKNTILYVFLSSITLTLNAYAWELKTSQEAWGETCYLSQTNQEGHKITIFSQQGSVNPAILISPYRSEYGNDFPVKLSVDSVLQLDLVGSSPEYFDQIYLDIDEKIIEAIRKGNQLHLKISNQDTLRFSLAGSSVALKDFSACIRQ